MPKKMSDDEAMEYAFNRLLGDMDGIESHALFDEDGEKSVEGTAANAEPETKASGGVKITIEPVMAAAQEGAKKSDTPIPAEDEEEEDKLKGISRMSPMMAALHPGR